MAKRSLLSRYPSYNVAEISSWFCVMLSLIALRIDYPPSKY